MSLSISSTLVMASAGSGKTYQLTLRYLTLLFAGVAPQRILATTFTRKAAGEITERVFSRLAELCRSDSLRAQFNKETGFSVTQSQCEEVLERFIKAQHLLQIGTLDHFALRLASALASDLGLPPASRVLTDESLAPILEETLSRVLMQSSPEMLRQLLDELFEGRRFLKLWDKLASFLEEGFSVVSDVEPTVWFDSEPPDDTAFPELLAQLTTLELPYGAKGPDKRWKQAHDDCVSSLTQGTWKAFYEKGLGKALYIGKSGTFYNKEIPIEIRKAYDTIQDYCGKKILAQLSRKGRALAALFHQIESATFRTSVERTTLKLTDFKRLLARTVQSQLLPHLYYRLDTSIDHLLLDEFQDTAPYEWEILLPLVNEILGDQTRGRTLFCVGDTKQAIYGWRGGDVRLFENLKSHESLTTLSLARSFRSSQAVISLVNTIFSASPHTAEEHPVLRRWESQFPQHSTTRTARGLARVSVGSEEEEAREKWLLSLLSEIKERRGLNSVALLFRTNADVQKYSQFLRTHHFHVSEEGKSPLAEEPVLASLLALLHLLSFPHDTVAKLHLMLSPWPKLLNLKENASEEEFSQFLFSLSYKLGSEGAPAFVSFCFARAFHVLTPSERHAFRQTIECALGWQEQGGGSLSSLISWIERKKVSNPSSSAIRLMNIHQAKGLEFDVVLLPDLSALLTGGSDQDRYLLRKTPGKSTVTFAAINPRQKWAFLHPKLLEAYEEKNQQTLEENLCILYVALTRAKDELFLYCSPEACTRKSARISFEQYIALKLSLNETSLNSPVAYEEGEKSHYEQSGVVTPESIPVIPQISLRPAPRRRALLKEAPSQLSTLSALEKLSEAERHQRKAEGNAAHATLYSFEWAAKGFPFPQLKALFSPSFYAGWKGADLVVWRERPFAVAQSDGVQVGVFDRVVLGKKEEKIVWVHLVEFKQSSLSLAQLEQEYKGQIKAYRQALLTMTKVPKENLTVSLVNCQTEEWKNCSIESLE